MCDVIREYTEKVNVYWVHKTIDALLTLDEYPLLRALSHTSDEEVLEIICSHTRKLLPDASTEMQTNVINEIVDTDLKRRMDQAIDELTEFHRDERAWQVAREVVEEQIKVIEATKVLPQILSKGELWVRIVPCSGK